jgi:polysaccharide pyruvyl transferase WcaK-like protein
VENLHIYGEPGSKNHGNEAIVRGVCKIFANEEIIVFSADRKSGEQFGLNKVCNLLDQGLNLKEYQLLFSLLKKLRLKKLSFYFQFINLFHKVNGIYLLEAGDQYCENDSVREFYAYINKKLNKLGAKTVMLGCTIDKEVLQKREVISDLKNYSLIIPRESITYQNLIKAGLEVNTTLLPCPAFLMDMKKCFLPSIFSGEVIGINTGFLSQGNEKYYDSLMVNYQELVDYIIKKTNYNIAFIPHVNWGGLYSDNKSMVEMYIKHKHTGRVAMIKDQNAMKLKYVISKCKFMIALRTHASVAALSMKVPTILTGYKTKTKGIVRDIMEGDESLIVELQMLKSKYELVDKFQWLEQNEGDIRDKLNNIVPDYIKKCYTIRETVNKLWMNN